MSSSKKLTLIQTSIGDYRQSVIDILYEKMGENFQIICGREYFYPSLKTGVSFNGKQKYVDNYFLLARKILVQKNVLVDAVKADRLILELNPRIVTNWIIAVLRKILFKPTTFWGHAWARNGPSSKSDPVREIMRRLGTTLIVYTETQKLELINIRKWDEKRIFAAPNALYKKSEMLCIEEINRKDFISVGRLVKDKKIDLLINSFSDFSIKNKSSVLHIVGSGPEEAALREMAKNSHANQRIIFYGHISDPKKLFPIYSKCLASVSPGYVGLSITQSLGFGIPMIISRDEPHAPEIEAAKENFNCLFFNTDSKSDLCGAMEKVFAERSFWIKSAKNINTHCQENYSAEHMANRIMEASIGR